MRSLYLLLLYFAFLSDAHAQDGLLTQQEFYQKIKQLYAEPSNVGPIDEATSQFLDSKLQLPSPLHKASRIDPVANDTALFFYYDYKHYDTLTAKTSRYLMDGDGVFPRYLIEFPMLDSNKTFCLLIIYQEKPRIRTNPTNCWHG